MHARLAERLGQHSQIQKQTALNKAASALLKCDLESKQLEPHHNILSLVYWLAQRPLDSPWMPDSEDDTDASSGINLHAFNAHQADASLRRTIAHEMSEPSANAGFYCVSGMAGCSVLHATCPRMPMQLDQEGALRRQFAMFEMTASTGLQQSIQ